MSNRKPIVMVAALALSILYLTATFAAQETPWFDLEKCEMCKNMTAEKGLMEHMEWENLLTADGIMSVTVVDPKYEEAFHRSMKNMQATGEKLMTGEKLYLCGFCQSFGALQMAGANIENFETKAGYINLVTAKDPELVKKIHAHGQRTIDEYAKMVAAEGEAGHDHDHGAHKH